MAPSPAGNSPPVPKQLRWTGWLLIGSAVLGLATAVFLVALDPEEDSRILLREVSGSGTVAGRITDAQGAGLRAVNVSVTGTTLYTGSDGNGEFRLEGIPAGHRNLTLVKEGHQTVHYHTFILADRGVRVEVRMTPGTGSRVEQDKSVTEDLRQTQFLCATMVLCISLITGAGGCKSLQGRDYTWVVGGAIFGLFSFGFVLGSLLALAALVMAIRHRRLYLEI